VLRDSSLYVRLSERQRPGRGASDSRDDNRRAPLHERFSLAAGSTAGVQQSRIQNDIDSTNRYPSLRRAGRTEQDKIIGAVKTLVYERQFKPVDLQFYDHENWHAVGERYRERGPEILLRKVRVSKSGITDTAARS
jgi:hypothetical protein